MSSSSVFVKLHLIFNVMLIYYSFNVYRTAFFMVLFQKPFSSGKTITKHQVRCGQNI